MRQKLRTLLLASVVIALIATVALLVSSTCKTRPYPPLPNPNGYDDFLQAAALIKGDVPNSSTPDHDGLRQLILSNAEPLRIIRVGLGRQCSVPTEEAVTNFTALSPTFPQMRMVSLLLSAEGRLAEIENRTADAARSDIDAIRFGNEISRGGLMIHRLIGIGCERSGATQLVKLVPKLNCKQAHPIILELEKIDQARVNWDEVLSVEKAFTRYTLRGNPINQLSLWWAIQGTRKTAKEKHNSAVAHLRLIIAELALRCYQADQARTPAGMQELVPKYLQRVPLDPFSGQPLIYRGKGTNWLLYSVGVDRMDDGGQPVGRPMPDSVTRGDLFFDSPW